MDPRDLSGARQRATCALFRPERIASAIQDQCEIVVAHPGSRFDIGDTPEGGIRFLPATEVGILGSELIFSRGKFRISTQGSLELVDRDGFAAGLLSGYCGRSYAMKIGNADGFGLSLAWSAYTTDGVDP